MLSRRSNWFRAALRLMAVGLFAVTSPPARAQREDLVVFAAASLKNALDSIANQWQRETGKTVKISYAASSALAKQIEQGAPAQRERECLFLPTCRGWTTWSRRASSRRTPA